MTDVLIKTGAVVALLWIAAGAVWHQQIACTGLVVVTVGAIHVLCTHQPEHHIVVVLLQQLYKQCGVILDHQKQCVELCNVAIDQQ
jgi:hypothetical protein